ncbi:BJDP [Alphabaculovirus myunipunctae]|uniref:BJDP n=1 Tax=Mythimna unipuncta nucleopolyhedrovirus TaxID=447897 RepID=A0A2K9VSH1_9ABAC|nr:BJDP [Mythimna unipuncta nucleopolyhedrovirus]AUV65386.1 BJDP [Mythimna unipuncta nucleopolyhedrovirus]
MERRATRSSIKNNASASRYNPLAHNTSTTTTNTSTTTNAQSSIVGRNAKTTTTTPPTVRMTTSSMLRQQKNATSKSSPTKTPVARSTKSTTTTTTTSTTITPTMTPTPTTTTTPMTIDEPVSRKRTAIRSSSTSSSESVKRQRETITLDLYTVNLDRLDLYTLLDVTNTANATDIKTAGNLLIQRYRKKDDSIVAVSGDDGDYKRTNTVDAIQKVLAEGISVLSNRKRRRVYDYVYKSKDYVIDFNERVDRLQRDVANVYNKALRIENDAREFAETDLYVKLKNTVDEAIESNKINKHYKVTKTNRIRVTWPQPRFGSIDEDVTRTIIDENYLRSYFENDNVVAIVMCGASLNCAVIEVLTSGSVNAIVERESKRNKFLVRDYTEAEYATTTKINYAPELDKLQLLLQDIERLEEQLRASEMDELQTEKELVQAVVDTQLLIESVNEAQNAINNTNDSDMED